MFNQSECLKQAEHNITWEIFVTGSGPGKCKHTKTIFESFFKRWWSSQSWWHERRPMSPRSMIISSFVPRSNLGNYLRTKLTNGQQIQLLEDVGGQYYGFQRQRIQKYVLTFWPNRLPVLFSSFFQATHDTVNLMNLISNQCNKRSLAWMFMRSLSLQSRYISFFSILLSRMCSLLWC